jgi:hypothetical protein
MRMIGGTEKTVSSQLFCFQDDFSIAAMKVVMTYLTHSPVATLQQVLVECPEPYCSDVDFHFIENSQGCLYITAENVPTEELDEVIPRFVVNFFTVFLLYKIFLDIT